MSKSKQSNTRNDKQRVSRKDDFITHHKPSMIFISSLEAHSGFNLEITKD